MGKCVSAQAKEANRQRSRAFRAMNKAKGLCVRCGKHPPRSGKTSCPECHIKEHASYLRQKLGGTHTTQRRKAQGLCATCELPLPKDWPHICCDACLANRRDQWHLHYGLRYSGNRAKAIKRDGYSCQLCGRKQQKGVGLHVHHIDRNGSTSAEPNNSLSNLVTLCQMCHYAITCFHQIPEEKRDLALNLLMA